MSIRLRLNVRSRLRCLCSVSGLPLVEFGVASACVLLSVTAAHAAGSGMPWEAPLERVLESVQGPVAKIVAVIIITVTGISLAFGDTSGGFRKMVQVVFGLSIAFAASSFFLSFFSFGGGALI
ncbi:TrbC/VirB2 family protein [Bradyrhizobium liaoningense]|uniref:TrbC/VirB2 family protein n=1 Tax=Bradyrhizobium liaoningense TaxID=43992 RepID=UPI001427D3B3|nr:TrbC/VirB2 family protein [Bradyrhizobium liaoningense]